MSELPVRWSDVTIHQAVHADANSSVTLSVLLDQSHRFQVICCSYLMAALLRRLGQAAWICPLHHDGTKFCQSIARQAYRSVKADQSYSPSPQSGSHLQVSMLRHAQVLNGSDLIAEGHIRAMQPAPNPPVLEEHPSIESKHQLHWPLEETSTIDAPAFYREFVRSSITYGPKFQMVQKASTDGSLAALR